MKLPAFFKVPTPIGSYNPDWAIVVEPRDEFEEPTGEQMLYLVRETKGTTNLDDLRPMNAGKLSVANNTSGKHLVSITRSWDNAHELRIQS